MGCAANGNMARSAKKRRKKDDEDEGLSMKKWRRYARECGRALALFLSEHRHGAFAHRATRNSARARA